MGSFILKPVFVHGFEKLCRKWESCLRTDDRVDATSRTQRGLTDLGLVFVYPLFDHGRGKRAATIEASAQIALFNLLSMAAGKAVGNVQIDEGFRIHNIPPIDSAQTGRLVGLVCGGWLNEAAARRGDA